jgi:hypothetical protein
LIYVGELLVGTIIIPISVCGKVGKAARRNDNRAVSIGYGLAGL